MVKSLATAKKLNQAQSVDLCSHFIATTFVCRNIQLQYVLDSRRWKRGQCSVPVSCLLIGLILSRPYRDMNASNTAVLSLGK